MKRYDFYMIWIRYLPNGQYDTHAMKVCVRDVSHVCQEYNYR